jgi:hypothetical protein
MKRWFVTALIIPDVHSRIRDVQRILSRIRPFSHGARTPVAAHMVSGGATKPYIVAAADKKLGESHRDWLFKTSGNDIWGQYEEIWDVSDSGSGELRSVALQLFEVRSPAVREEICAMHCEPTHIGDGLTSSCKRCPHVHLTVDRNRLGRAHIPLNIAELQAGMPSLEALNRHFEVALEVFELEVIERL